MTVEERNIKLKHLITCMKCEVSGKACDENCPTQYEAGNMGEIIENLEAISEILEQKPCDAINRRAVLNTLDKMDKALDTDRTVENYKELLTECYKDLPPVTPKEKTAAGTCKTCSNYSEHGICDFGHICVDGSEWCPKQK